MARGSWLRRPGREMQSIFLPVERLRGPTQPPSLRKWCPTASLAPAPCTEGEIQPQAAWLPTWQPPLRLPLPLECAWRTSSANCSFATGAGLLRCSQGTGPSEASTQGSPALSGAGQEARPLAEAPGLCAQASGRQLPWEIKSIFWASLSLSPPSPSLPSLPLRPLRARSPLSLQVSEHSPAAGALE